MSEPQPTVYIVDHDTIRLRKLRALLAAPQIRVKTYRAPDEFLRDRAAFQPGCLLLGVRLPQMSGLVLHRRLQEQGDRIPVIFVAADDQVGTAVAALREGAFDFLPHPIRAPYLRERVRAALQKDRRERQQAAGQIAAAARFEDLSPRETRVLDLMMAGKPAQEIARELGITRQRASRYRTSILRKVNAGTVAELAYFYFAGGLHEVGRLRGTITTTEPTGGAPGKSSRNRSNPWALLTTRRGTWSS